MKPTLNLLPPEAQPTHIKTSALLTAAAPVLYILAILGLWFFNNIELTRLSATIEQLSGNKATMQRHLAATPAGIPPIAPTDTEVLSMMKTTPPWDTMLAEISTLLPKTVWLNLIESTNAKNLRLKGFSKNQTDIAELISRLEGSPYFRNVRIVFAQKGKNASAFELTVEMIWT